MIKKLLFILSVLVLLTPVFLTTGCKDSITAEDLDKVVIPDKDVSYNQYIQPVFNLKCNNAGCHNDETRAGGLSLTSWTNTTADLAVVYPTKPENSTLAIFIQPTSSNPMPPAGYRPLTENQMKGIITWIKEGAKNN